MSSASGPADEPGGITRSRGAAASRCSVSPTRMPSASMSVRPGPDGSPVISGITEPSRSAQISVTSGWLRDRAAARLAATRLAPWPRETPGTRITCRPRPIAPMTTCASSENSRPTGDRGAAIASSGPGLPAGRLISTGTSSRDDILRPADPAPSAVGEVREHQADHQAGQQPARHDEQSASGWQALAGGMALLMIDPPDGLASAAVSCATWLFSELSWL